MMECRRSVMSGGSKADRDAGDKRQPHGYRAIEVPIGLPGWREPDITGIMSATENNSLQFSCLRVAHPIS